MFAATKKRTASDVYTQQNSGTTTNNLDLAAVAPKRPRFSLGGFLSTFMSFIPGGSATPHRNRTRHVTTNRSVRTASTSSDESLVYGTPAEKLETRRSPLVTTAATPSLRSPQAQAGSGEAAGRKEIAVITISSSSNEDQNDDNDDDDVKVLRVESGSSAQRGLQRARTVTLSDGEDDVKEVAIVTANQTLAMARAAEQILHDISTDAVSVVDDEDEEENEVKVVVNEEEEEDDDDAAASCSTTESTATTSTSAAAPHSHQASSSTAATLSASAEQPRIWFGVRRPAPPPFSWKKPSARSYSPRLHGTQRTANNPKFAPASRQSQQPKHLKFWKQIVDAQAADQSKPGRKAAVQRSGGGGGGAGGSSATALNVYRQFVERVNPSGQSGTTDDMVRNTLETLRAIRQTGGGGTQSTSGRNPPPPQVVDLTTDGTASSSSPATTIVIDSSSSSSAASSVSSSQQQLASLASRLKDVSIASTSGSSSRLADGASCSAARRREAELMEEWATRQQSRHGSTALETPADAAQAKLGRIGTYVPKPKARKEKDEWPALTQEQRALVLEAWNKRLTPDEVLVKTSAGVTLTRKDLLTLHGLSWLNDEVINGFLAMVVARSSSSPGLPRAYAFNTFFLKALRERGYAAVKRWTRKVDLFEYAVLLVPVHLEVHWCMLVVDLEHRHIDYYDSLGGGDRGVLQIVMRYLRDEYAEKKGGATLPDADTFKLRTVKDCPQQSNTSDCGVFACRFAEWASRRKEPITFTHAHMPYYRERTVVELIQGRLFE